MVLLSNSIHVRGSRPIQALRGEVATAVAQALVLPAITRSHPGRHPFRRRLGQGRSSDGAHGHRRHTSFR